MVIVKPHVELPAASYANGVKIALVSVVRNHPSTVNPLIKSNNLLNNALAMQEAQKRGAAEALMKNHRGELCECAMSNIFLVTKGELRTPPTDAGILAGVTRAFVLELAAKAGIRARARRRCARRISRPPTRCSSPARRARSSRSSASTIASIGSGTPGPVTRRLRAAFAGAVSALAPTA